MVAAEVLVATPAIRNLIREGKIHQVFPMLQSGRKFGMNTMDEHLGDLVSEGRITIDAGAACGAGTSTSSSARPASRSPPERLAARDAAVGHGRHGLGRRGTVAVGRDCGAARTTPGEQSSATSALDAIAKTWNERLVGVGAGEERVRR